MGSIKEEIFALIHEGLDSRDFETRHAAKIFADSIKRTSKIMRVERQKRIRDDGKLYLKQLVFMTKYLMQNPGLSIEERMRTLRPKLSELEEHQLRQILHMQRLSRSRSAKKGKASGKKQKAAKKRKNPVRKGKKH